MSTVVVPWAAGSQLGLFGKIPSKGDFVHLRAADDQKWCEWLQRGVERANAKLGARWQSLFDGGTPHGFLMRQATGAVLSGLLTPSRDTVGRRFPLSAYVQLSASDVTTVKHLVPWALSPLNQLLPGVLAPDNPTSDPLEAVRSFTVHGVSAEQGEAQYQSWLRATPARPWFEQVWGRPDPELPRYSVAMMTSSLEQYVGLDNSTNPLALRLPLAGDLRAAAFWLDLVGRMGGWKVTVPTVFWSVTNPRSVLVQLGEAKPSSFVELWAPGVDDEHVIDLCSLGSVNAAPFLGSVPAPMARCLAADGSTLWDVLAAAGAKA